MDDSFTRPPSQKENIWYEKALELSGQDITQTDGWKLKPDKFKCEIQHNFYDFFLSRHID